MLCRSVFSKGIIIKHTCAQRMPPMPLSHYHHSYLLVGLRERRRVDISIFLCLSCTAELGDYSETEHTAGYLSEYCFIPNPPQDFHKEVSKHHQQHRYAEKRRPRAFRYKPAEQVFRAFTCTYVHTYLVLVLVKCSWKARFPLPLIEGEFHL